MKTSATTQKSSPTTLSADFQVWVDVDISNEQVQDWLYKASASEIATLKFDSSDDDEEDGLPHGAVSIPCGRDAGTRYELDCIQEILDRLDTTEVLRRLRA